MARTIHEDKYECEGGNKEYLPCCQGACVNISSSMAFILLIVNIFTAGIGTIISGVIDSNGINCTAICVGLI